MKNEINKYLNELFENKNKRKPSEDEKKYMKYLSSLYARDMKYILKLEMKEMKEMR